MGHVFAAWTSLGRVMLDARNLDPRQFRRFFRRIRRDLNAVIAERQAGGEIDPALDPSLVGATLIGAIDGLLLQQLADPAAFPDPDALSNSLVLTMRRVLRA